MRQLVTRCPQLFLILLLAPFNLCPAQQGAVASLRDPNASIAGNSSGPESVRPAEQEAILARFVAAETKVREALNQHTFRRDVVLQTIGPNGEVTGEYIRNSQFIFDDRGRRIERVIFHPSSTIREMRITKEDIQDLKDGQLLGIDIVEATKYRLAYAGVETVNNRQLLAVDVAPLTQPDPNRMKERYFVGRVWVDPQTFQIVMLKGIMEPQGKQRFPMFVTWREPVKDALAFPTRTEADDILHFKERDVHYRIKVRYYDYKEFGSRVNITDVDEGDAQFEEAAPETKDNPGKREPSSKSSETPTRLTTSTSDRTSNSEMCTTNRTAPPVGEYHWPTDAEVKVYFVRSMFNPEQTAVMLEAMKTWNMVGADNGSGVRFSYGGETDSRMSCRNCLTVTRKDVFARERRYYALFHPMKQEEGRLLVSAWIDLDFGITDPTALQGFMAHEMGHGLGLWDCQSCKKKRSLMNSFPGINKNNGLVAPSSCDVATMRGVYQQERQIATAMRRDNKSTDLKPAASALALPTLEKAGSFALDSSRPFTSGTAAARNFVDSRAKTVSVEQVVAPTPRGLEVLPLNPFGLQSPQVYKSLFSSGRMF